MHTTCKVVEYTEIGAVTSPPSIPDTYSLEALELNPYAKWIDGETYSFRVELRYSPWRVYFTGSIKDLVIYVDQSSVKY